MKGCMVGLWTLRRSARLFIGCLGRRASGCLQMSRYHGSEGDAVPGFGGGFVGLFGHVSWDWAWYGRAMMVVVEMRWEACVEII